ncbi:hypothetical protein PQX77_012998 [Marasmius sp. AFHP31]|nr:hypothetical protein PQX77_012998 [Marasmius sp. AFHP31]
MTSVEVLNDSEVATPLHESTEKEQSTLQAENISLDGEFALNKAKEDGIEEPIVDGGDASNVEAPATDEGLDSQNLKVKDDVGAYIQEPDEAGNGTPLDHVTPDAVIADIAYKEREKNEESISAGDVASDASQAEGITESSTDKEQEVISASDAAVAKAENVQVDSDTKTSETGIPDDEGLQAKSTPLDETSVSQSEEIHGTDITAEPTSHSTTETKEELIHSEETAINDVTPVSTLPPTEAGASHATPTAEEKPTESILDEVTPITEPTATLEDNTPAAPEITASEAPVFASDATTKNDESQVSEAASLPSDAAEVPIAATEASNDEVSHESSTETQPPATADTAVSHSVLSDEDLLNEQAEIVPELKETASEHDEGVQSGEKVAGEEETDASAVNATPESKVVDALAVAPDATAADQVPEETNTEDQSIAPIETESAQLSEVDPPAKTELEEDNQPFQMDAGQVGGENEGEVKEDAEKTNAEAQSDAKVVDALPTAPDTVISEEAENTDTVQDEAPMIDQSEEAPNAESFDETEAVGDEVAAAKSGDVEEPENTGEKEKEETPAPVESLPESDTKVVDAVPHAPDTTVSNDEAGEYMPTEETDSTVVGELPKDESPAEDTSLSPPEDTTPPVMDDEQENTGAVETTQGTEVVDSEETTKEEEKSLPASESLPELESKVDETVPDSAAELSEPAEEMVLAVAENTQQEPVPVEPPPVASAEDTAAPSPISEQEPVVAREPEQDILATEEAGMDVTIAEDVPHPEGEGPPVESHPETGTTVIDAVPHAPDTTFPTEEAGALEPEEEAVSAAPTQDKDAVSIDNTSFDSAVATGGQETAEADEPVQEVDDIPTDTSVVDTVDPLETATEEPKEEAQIESLPLTDAKVLDAVPHAPDTAVADDGATLTNTDDEPITSISEDPAQEDVSAENLAVEDAGTSRTGEEETTIPQDTVQDAIPAVQPSEAAPTEANEPVREAAVPALSDTFTSKVIDAIPAAPDTSAPDEGNETSQPLEAEATREEETIEVGEVDKIAEQAPIDAAKDEEPAAASAGFNAEEGSAGVGEAEDEDEAEEDDEGDGEEPIIPPRPRRLTVSVTIEHETHIDEVASHQYTPPVDEADDAEGRQGEEEDTTEPLVSQSSEAALEPAKEIDISGSSEEKVRDLPESEVVSHLSVGEETERPKSPWTPSYSVTSQGPGITAEEDIPEIEPISEAQRAEEPIQTVEEVPIVNVTVPTVTQHGDATPEDKLSQPAEEPPRPTSPWTPSYSVSRQGSPAPPSAEISQTNEVNISEGEDSTVSQLLTETSKAEVSAAPLVDKDWEEPTASTSEPEQTTEDQSDATKETSPHSQQLDSPVELSEPQQATATTTMTEEPPAVAPPVVEVSESLESIHADAPTNNVHSEPIAVDGSDTVVDAGIARPTSPWPKSYSVAQQGSPQPPATKLSEDEVQADSAQTEPQNPTTEQPIEEPSQSAAIFTGAKIEVSAMEEVSTASVEPKVGDASTYRTLAAEPPAEETQSSPALDVEPESKSQWTPSYSVTTQGTEDSTGDSATASTSARTEEIKSDDKVEDVHFAPEPIVADAAKSNTLSVDTSATSAESTPQRPRSPWTPSYSVMRQGAGSTDALGDEAELAKLEQLPAPEVQVIESTTQNPLPTAPDGKASEPFPTSESYEEEGSLTSLDTVTDNRDAPSSPSARSRLESTASSLMFPGGWFSRAPPGRASLDNAKGEFIPNKPTSPVEATTPELNEETATPTNEATPTAEPTSPTSPTEREKRSKWLLLKDKMLLTLMSVQSYALCLAAVQHSSAFTHRTWDESVNIAQETVSQLTLDEKVGLVTGLGSNNSRCSGNVTPPNRSFMVHDLNITIPALCMNDGPAGIRGAKDVTAFPSGINVASTFSRRLMHARGVALGKESRVKGVNLFLGPAMDIMRNPKMGRAWESYGADPYLAGEAAYETVAGLQSEGVQAVAKHYVANNQETWRYDASSEVEDRVLHEIYNYPFLRAIDANVSSVMCSYNRVNQTHACNNENLLGKNGVLRSSGFEGFVMSDWYATHGTAQENAAAGLDMEQPGDHLAEPFNGGGVLGANLTKAVTEGEVPESRVDEMVTRILASWLRLGQEEDFPEVNFDSRFPDGSGPNNTVVDARSEEHTSLTREIGAASAVLLKNERKTDDGTPEGSTIRGLPLSESQIKSLAVIGRDAKQLNQTCGGSAFNMCNEGTMIMGWGSGSVILDFVIPPVDAVKSFVGDSVEVATSLSNNATEGSVAAEGKDVALVFVNAISGENVLGNTLEGASGDRIDLNLWYNGDELIESVAAVNPNTVVVIHSVGPVAASWATHPNITAIVYAGAPGEQTGPSIVDVLWGAVNPSGRLPFSIDDVSCSSCCIYPPKLTFLSVNQSEESYGTEIIAGDEVPTVRSSHSSTDPSLTFEQIEYTEGLFIDYRYMDSKGIVPRFEFGYGLSYTTFNYSELSISSSDDTQDIEFTLTNTGAFDGTEIPQLYLGFPEGSGEPPRVLRGFDDVKLAKGESTVVKFSLTQRELR